MMSRGIPNEAEGSNKDGKRSPMAFQRDPKDPPGTQRGSLKETYIHRNSRPAVPPAGMLSNVQNNGDSHAPICLPWERVADTSGNSQGSLRVLITRSYCLVGFACNEL